MKTFAAVVMLCVAACWAAPAWPQEARQSTEQERKDFLKGAALHEKDPLSETAQTFRAWAVDWLEEVEDIVVALDGSVLGPILEQMPEDYAYREVLADEYTIACGVYALQNEKKEDDPVRRNVQALERCLCAYQSIIKDHPERKTASMDNIQKISAEKKIEEYVKEQLKKGEEEEDQEDEEGEDA